MTEIEIIVKDVRPSGHKLVAFKATLQVENGAATKQKIETFIKTMLPGHCTFKRGFA